MDFSQLALYLCIAAAAGVVAKLLRQPILIGYLFAGFLLSLFGFIRDSHSIESLGQIGVTLLLFLVGLEMKIHELKTVGKIALLTGLGQIVFTSGIGFVIAQLLGYSTIASVYIAVALTFSSTIIIMKLLSEKKDLSSLYGKISIGFLLIQDLVAVVILMLLSGLGKGNLGAVDYALVAIKAIFLFGGVWFLSKKILPRLFSKLVSSSNELLFIVAIAWAVGFAAFVQGPLGFSFEIGGFLAGLALSNLPDQLQVAARTRPIRDFFLTLFFMVLGSKMIVTGVGEIAGPAIILSLFVLIGNPLIVLIIMGISGYRRRTSLLAGLTVAQISEFSLILMAMGESLGHINRSQTVLVLMVGIVTMTLSTYMILGGERLYSILKRYLTLFERKKILEPVWDGEVDLEDHVVLVGCDRTGKRLVSLFKKNKISFIVIDFNPKVYQQLRGKNIPVILGDFDEEEIREKAGVKKARMIISTVSNVHDNLILLESLPNIKSSSGPVLIFTAQTPEDARVLYQKGASYVIVPQFVAGDYLRHLIKTHGAGSKITKLGKSHYKRLLLT